MRTFAIRDTAWILSLGWYLMTAPFSGAPTDRRVDPSAPLSEWHILAPYDSIAECEQRRHAFIRSAKTPATNERSLLCVPIEDSRIELGGSLPEKRIAK